MKLTTHTDYALRLLIFLGVREDDEPATVPAAARHYGISNHHLAKVSQTLVQLGYLVSVRGRGGGLKLARPSDKIAIGPLVREIENLELLECFGANSTCPIDPACRLKGVLFEAQQAFLSVLDRYVLADLIENRQTLRLLLGEPG
ncbi:Rrf2 family transcriptional regulator [Salinicola halophilus]|uniref:Rrf2 family transcriptional regulator n=1 Tax=Salinicola halophilus TaxID=184065 RepID=UPI000DA22541|nr:Rrf2 family transcriptional regulator [Salinicola halophilus]